MMTKSNKIIYYFVILQLLMWPADTYSQSITTTALSDTSCPEQIVIPVTVSNFDSVSAISLALMYDDEILNFLDYQSLHDSLTDGFTVVNGNAGTVILSWVSIETASILDQDTIFELVFQSFGGSSPLIWDTITPGYCEFSDADGNTITANYNNGNALIYYMPEITQHPSDVIIIEGGNTGFSIQSFGSGLIFQWQLSENSGSSWENLNNSATYSGVHSPDLNISNAGLSMNGFWYRCQIEGICPPATESEAAILTVNPTPQLITTSVPGLTECPGLLTVPISVQDCDGVGAFSLTLDHSGGVLNFAGYQNAHPELTTGDLIVNSVNNKVLINWASLNGANIGNGTLLELLFETSTGSCPLTWQDMIPGACEYSDIDGNIINAIFVDAQVIILQPPKIIEQPISTTIITGETAIFLCTANGDGIYWQWQVSSDAGNSWNDLENNVLYSGVNSSELVISEAPPELNTNQYRCFVSGTCQPGVYSNSAVLTLNPVPQMITATLPEITQCPGEVIVPIHVDACTGVGAISLGIGFEVSVLEYVGYQNLHPQLAEISFMINELDGMILMNWASLEPIDINNGTLIELVFNGQTGISSIDWLDQNEGLCEFADMNGNGINATYVDGNATIYQVPEITGHPENITIIVGENAELQVLAIGTGLTYQWQMSINGGSNWNDLTNNPTFSGVASSVLAISGVTLNMNGNFFRCKVSGTCQPMSYSENALLTVNPVPQLITTSIGSSTAIKQEITLPVTVTDCYNVAAISLKLDFDASVLDYIEYTNLHPALEDGFLIINGTPGHCIISWAALNPVNIGNETLVELKFGVQPGSTSVDWDVDSPGGCEYSDVDGNIIQSAYVNGSVSVEGFLLDVKVFLEGPFDEMEMETSLNPDFIPHDQPYDSSPWNYNGTETLPANLNPDVVDWLLIELRETSGDSSTANGASAIGSQACLLLKDGSISRTSSNFLPAFNGTISQNLYVVIYHRNHLPIMSANPLVASGIVYEYDFTIAPDQFYGGEDGCIELLPDNWGMVAGDGDANQVVEIENDLNPVWREAAGQMGYLPGDFNLDAQVDNRDKNENLISNFGRSSQVPE